MSSRRLRSSMGDFPSDALLEPPTGPCSVFRSFSLPQGGPQVLGVDLKCPESVPYHPTQSRCNPNLGILKYGRKRGAAAICERIRASLACVRDEAQDGHVLDSFGG